jgi:hypothetical protein
MTLDQAREHIGHGVVYHPMRPGVGGGLLRDAEDGVITSVGEQYVFVRYAGDQNSKATDPAALTLLAGDPR